ncbi:MFS transporter [Marichromatium gracile]|uniref:Acyl-[acyl-carrier-protein]-phospholipid O-acyltransferase/long-chain-fatty-acid--[acyl-carrier-protein] ligase n=1 Tax=Marichromatium gracile TaxID=1048 RepID=A0A4R4AKQ9_MARGR|nr:MFS transporter [Marichromatium gracile]MBK1707649.1 acyl-[ACP]--phospholipid O-acyltransferase [Marichromatium gracile]TCW40001.1 acyl-[acyl-carrier-protein]-phospholipid O-acyltransferase/long-chain-fatty-acid--[acyl-carrier-protein] ligase [Marichromatium gracile]
MGQSPQPTALPQLQALVALNGLGAGGVLALLHRALSPAAAAPLAEPLVWALLLAPSALLAHAIGGWIDRRGATPVLRLAAWTQALLVATLAGLQWRGWPGTPWLAALLLGGQLALFAPAVVAHLQGLTGKHRLGVANAQLLGALGLGLLAGWSLLLLTPTGADLATRLHQLLPALVPLVLAALAQLALTRALARAPEPAPKPPLAGPLLAEVRALRANPVIWRSLIGVTLFWAIAAGLLFGLPAALDERPLPLLWPLAAGLVGLVLGALLAARLSRDHIESALASFGAIGVAVSLLLLPGLSGGAQVLALAAFGLAGALFLVPLQALIQFHVTARHGSALGCAQALSRAGVLGGTLAVAAALALGIAPGALLGVLALTALLGAGYTLYHLPQSLARFVAGRLLATRYRLAVIGVEQLPPLGGVLLLGNHVSWIDWAVVQMAAPRPVRFVMERGLYERWYLRHLLDFFGVIPISGGASREATARVTRLLEAGEVVCLFPEGTLSKNGQLSAFKRGFERAASAATGAVIVPFYLRGLWGSRFSYASDQLKANRRVGRTRDLVVAFGAPMTRESSAEQVKQAVFELSVSSWQRHVEQLPSLPEAWLEANRRTPARVCLADAEGASLGQPRLAGAALAFALEVRARCPGPRVGILLPASVGAALANLAALLAGKTVVNLNYTTGPEVLRQSIARADCGVVLTSRRFRARLAQRGIDLDAALDGVEAVALEDLRGRIGRVRPLLLIVLARLLPPRWLLRALGARLDADETAAILFSSGSEGLPKGVELTHRNILANVRQIADVLNTERDDLILANLPPFHAFGLTVTTFLPLLEGIPVVCHPDPTDALANARAIARYRATVLCSTSSFLRLYLRHPRVHPLMLQSLRVVVAGAERLDPEVRKSFLLRFNKPIYEGYGATETTPVASVNVPDALETATWKVQIGSRPGSVGMPLPGTSFRIVDPEDLRTLPPGEEGLILIGGVQVMKGYLDDPERTAATVITLDGMRWYRTGDKGRVDADGFLTIVERYSRFAKIGGEMVGLGHVEQQVKAALACPELDLVATTLPDPRKGERIVLLVSAVLELDQLRGQLRTAGMTPLEMPAEIHQVERIPRLGSGKVDYGASRRLAADLATCKTPKEST